MKPRLSKFWNENKALLLFLVLMFAFRSAIADWNHIPSGSMQPTILIGDRILVNKTAYDIRLPFVGFPLVKMADPLRGDIVVFESAVSGNRLVKRVVGVPNDVVAMKDNVLYINGRELDYKNFESKSLKGESTVGARKIENLFGVEHIILARSLDAKRSSFNPVKVPEGQYLVLGDNRDNSADSRVIGFIPRHEIIGRARHVVMSFNYDNYYIPRSDRFFHAL